MQSLVERMKMDLELRDYSPCTIKSYLWHINKFERDISKPAAELTPEHIRRYLETKYGRDLLYGGGLKVYTTVDLDMQYSAQNALKRGLLELDKRGGFRGPLSTLSPEEEEEFF